MLHKPSDWIPDLHGTCAKVLMGCDMIKGKVNWNSPKRKFSKNVWNSIQWFIEFEWHIVLVYWTWIWIDMRYVAEIKCREKKKTSFVRLQSYMYSNCYMKCIYICATLTCMVTESLCFQCTPTPSIHVFVLLPTIKRCTCHLQRYSLYHNLTIQKVNSWLWCICCIMLTTAWTSEEGLINHREKRGKKKERKKKKKRKKKKEKEVETSRPEWHWGSKTKTKPSLNMSMFIAVVKNESLSWQNEVMLSRWLWHQVQEQIGCFCLHFMGSRTRPYLSHQIGSPWTLRTHTHSLKDYKTPDS